VTVLAQEIDELIEEEEVVDETENADELEESEEKESEETNESEETEDNDSEETDETNEEEVVDEESEDEESDEPEEVTEFEIEDVNETDEPGPIVGPEIDDVEDEPEEEEVEESTEEDSEESNESEESEEPVEDPEPERRVGAELTSSFTSPHPSNTHPLLSIEKSNEIQSLEQLQERLTVEVTDANGEIVETEWELTEEEEQYIVLLSPTDEFSPGKHHIEATLGTTRLLRKIDPNAEDQTLLSVDFLWGGIIFNTDRVLYIPGETASIALTPLNNDGKPLCASEVSIQITSPDETESELTIANESIAQSPACEEGGEGTPLYNASVPIENTGEYELTIRMLTEEGVRSMTHVLSAQEERLLTVKRSGDSLVQSGGEGQMIVAVTPTYGFVGSIVQELPEGFTVTGTSPAAELEMEAGNSILTWKKKWEAGVTVEITIDYTAPEKSGVFTFMPELKAEGTVELLEKVEVVPEPEEEPEESSSSSESEESSESSETSDSEDRSEDSSSSEISSDSSSEISESSESEESESSESSSPESSESSSEESESSSSEQSEEPIVEEPEEPSEEETDESAWNILKRFLSWGTRQIIPIAHAQEFQEFITERMLKYTEGRRWQIVIVDELAPVEVVEEESEEDAEESEESEEEVIEEENDLVLEANEDQEDFAMDSEPEFVLVQANEIQQVEEQEITEEEAMEAILDAVIDDEDIEEVVIEELVESFEVQQEVAEEILTDSIATQEVRNALVGSVVNERPTSTRELEQEIREVIQDEESVQEAVVEEIKNDVEVSEMVEEIVTEEVREEIIAALAEGQNEEELGDEILTAVSSTEISEIAQVIAQDAEVQEAVVNAIEEVAAAPEEVSEEEPIVQVTVTNVYQERFDPSYHFKQEEDGSTVLVLDKDQGMNLRPGLYTLEATITNPLTGEAQTLTQDFRWGVLAMNAHQDRYKPGDTAHIAIGVLDDIGRMVCDADLTLTIQDPSGESTILSSVKGDIVVSNTCKVKVGGLITPDYSVYFTPVKQGTYTLKLEAETDNGTRSIVSELVVDENPPMIIERRAATRLWPLADSPMDITIEFGVPFGGTVVESLPKDFVLSNISDGGTVVYGEKQEIHWRVDAMAGDRITLHYDYDAPDISPEFYLVGPLALTNDINHKYEELRSWQIANDDVTKTINGTVYQSINSNAIGANKTVTYLLNGEKLDDVETTAAGMFTLSGATAMTGGSIVTIFIEDETEDAVMVTLGSGGAMTGMNLFTDYLIIRSDSGSVSITNEHLDAANNGDSDINAIYTVDSNTLNVKADKNLYVWGSGTTFAPGGDVNLGSGIVIDGTFNATGSTIRFSGSWLTTQSGTFTRGQTGYVLLDGGSQSMSGNNVFNNLEKIVTTAKTLWIGAGGRQAVSGGTLRLKGTANNLLSLRSGKDGQAAKLILFGYGNYFQDFEYLDVKDMDSSHSSGTTMYCQVGCIDSGNNSNWIFTQKIYGTAYESDGTTPLTSTLIKFATGANVLDSTTTDGAGHFTLSGAILVAGEGEPMTLFIDDGTATGATVILGSGAAMTGLTIRANHLIVQSESGTTAITNTHLGIADDSGDRGVTEVFTVAGGELTTKSGMTLMIWTNDTFTPGGAVHVGSGIVVNGVFTMGANNVTLSGSWITYGSFTASNTVTFNGVNKLGNVKSFASSFNNIAFNGASSTWTAEDNLDANGTFAVQAGTFVQGTKTLNVGGNFTISNGATFTKSSNDSLLTFDGDLTLENEAGTNLGDVQMGTSPDTITLSGALLVDFLRIGTGDILVTSGFDVSIAGQLQLHGLLNASESGTRDSIIAVSGSWLASGTGDFLSGSSSVVFNGTSGNNTIDGSGSFHNLTINGAGGSWTGSGNTDLNKDFALLAGTFVAPPQTMTISGSWLKEDTATFTHNDGTVTLDGSDQTVSGSTIFNNFTKSVTTAQTLTFAATAQQSFSGTLTLNGAASNLLSLRSSISGVASKLYLDADGTQSLSYLDVKDSDASAGTQLQCTTCTDSGNNTNWLFAYSTVTGKLFDGDGSTELTDTTVAFATGANIVESVQTDGGGMFILSGTTILTGPLSIFIDDGSATGALMLLGSGSSMSGLSLFANHLIVRSESGSNAITTTHLGVADNTGDRGVTEVFTENGNELTTKSGITLMVWSGDTFTPDGALHIGSGVVVNGTLTLGSNNVTLSGSWMNEGTVTMSNTVTFNGVDENGAIKSSSSTFNNVTINGSNSTWTVADAMDIDGNLTLSAGTLDQGTSTMNVAGNVYIAAGATFTKSSNSSLLTLDGDLYIENEAGGSIGTVQAGSSPDLISMSGALTVDKLTIGTGDILRTNGYDLFIGDGGLMLHGQLDASNSGSRISTVRMSGSWLQHGTGDFLSGSSTVLFNGTSGNHTISASGSFFSLMIAGTGGTWTGSGNIDINGNFVNGAGTFVAPPQTMTVSGSWFNIGGTFTHNNGTVQFDGGNQVITGSTFFNNFTKTVTTAQTLTFPATVTQYFSGTLTLQGLPSNLLNIRSSTDGVAALIALDAETGNEAIQYTDVKDSDASGGQQISCSTCTDSTGNTNWDFSSVAIAGRLLDSDGSTPMDSKLVKYATGSNVLDSITTDANGFFVLSGSSLPTGPQTLFIDDGSATGALVMLGSGTTMTGLTIYAGHLIVRNESGSNAVTNIHLDTADDSADRGITEVYSITSNELTTKSGITLMVWSGDTFTPGGALHVGSGVVVNGTLTMSTSGVTLSGAWITEGSFTASNTVTFNGADENASIIGSGSAFNNVTINGSNSTWTLGGAMDVNGNLSIQAGTLDQGTSTMNVAGNVYIAAGATFTKSSDSSLLTLDGDLYIENEAGGSIGTVQAGSSPDLISMSGALTVDKLTIGTGDILRTNGYDLFIGDGGLMLHGQLDASNSGSRISTIRMSGSWLQHGTGDFLSGSSTVLFNGTSGNHTISTSGSFFSLMIAGTGGTWTGSGNIDINGNFVNGAGTFVAPPQTMTVSGSWFNIGGTFTHNNGTVQFDGGNQVITGSTIFNNFTKTITAAQTLTFAATVTQYFSGTLTLRGGTDELNLRSSTDGVAALLALDEDSGAQNLQKLNVRDMDASGGSQLSCLNCTNVSNNTNWIFPVGTIVGTAYASDGVTKLTNTLIKYATGANVIDSTTTDGGGQFTMSGTAAPTGPLTLFVDDGTETGALVMLGSGGTMTGLSLYAGHLIIRSESGSVAVTNTYLDLVDSSGDNGITSVFSVASNELTTKSGMTLMVWSGDTFTPGGALHVGSGIVINGTLTMGNSGVTLSGAWITEGSFTASNTVTFNGVDENASITSNGGTFTNVTINGSNSTWTVTDAMDIDGNLTVSAGTLAQGTSTMNVAGNVYIAAGATFTKSSNSSLLTLDGDLYIENEAGGNLGTVQAGSSPDLISLSGALTVDKLTIGTGDILRTNGYDLNIGNGGLMLHGLLDSNNSGSRISTIRMSGSWLQHGTGDFLSGSSTVLFDGASGNYTISASGAFYDLVFSGTGGTWTGSGNIDVNGDFVIGAGTFVAPPQTMTVSGSWFSIGGTFTHNSGTVNLDGSNQTITGATIFYNLTKTVSTAQTLTLAATVQHSVSGTLTLTGVQDNLLSIRSSTDGVEVFLIVDGSGSTSLSYLDVKDNNASRGIALSCSNCTDSGNNTAWSFTTNTIAGRLLDSDRSTALASKTVKMATGSVILDTTTTNANGSFTLSGSTTPSGPVVIFIDDGTATGATVVVGSGGSMTGIDVYANHLTVRSESGSNAITNTHLGVADDSGDNGISAVYSISSNVLSTETGMTLLVWTGSTFAPGSGMYIGSGIIIRGTFTMADDDVTLSGSWITETNGSFSASSNTVTFDGVNTGRGITSYGSSFNNVTINSTGEWTLNDATDINGNLMINSGTLVQGTSTLNIAGNFYIDSSATFTKSTNDALLTLDGDLYIENEAGGSIGTVQAGSSPDLINMSGALTVDKLTIGTGDILRTNGYDLFIGTGGLMLHGQLDASNSGSRVSTIRMSGSWLQHGTGDFLSGSSTVLLNGTAGSYTISASGSFYDLVFSGTGGTWTGSGSIDVNGDFVIGAGTFVATPQTMTVSGTWFSIGGTFTHNSGSIVLDGSNQTITGSTVFYNLTKTGATAQTLTIASGTQQSISGALILKGARGNLLSIRSGTAGTTVDLRVDEGSGSQDLELLDVKDNDASGGAPLTCSECTDSGNNTNWIFNTSTVAGIVYEADRTTLRGSATVKYAINSVIFETATTDAGGEFTLSGSTMTGGDIITLLLADGTATGASIILGSGSSMTGVDLYANHVIVRSDSGSYAVTNTHLATADNAGDSAITDTFSVDSNNIAHVQSGVNLLVWTGSTFTPGSGVTVGSGIIIRGAFTMADDNVTLSGSWTTETNGSFTASNTVTFDGTYAGRTITSNSSTFNNVLIAGTNGAWTLADAMDVNGTMTIGSGTFAQGTSTLNVAGNFTIVSGTTFTKSTDNSLFTLDGDLTIEDETGVNVGDVQIGSSPDTVTLSGSLLTDNLTIGTGDILVLSGNNLSVSGSVIIHGQLNAGSGTSTISVTGSWLAYGTGDLLAGSSTVRFNGTSGTHTITASGAFNDVTFNGAGGTWTGSGDIDINDDLTLTAGTFTGTPQTLTLSGTWLNNGGTFAHNSGSVTLDGGDQTVSGANVFFNFTKEVGSMADTLTFAAGVMQSFSGTLLLEGLPGRLLNIRSSQSGNAAQFALDDGSGVQRVTFLDVKDNDASGGATITCVSCQDSGNNTNWTFVTPSIVGTVFEADRQTPIASATVSYSIGANLYETETADAGGQFTLSGAIMTGGDIVTLFLNGGTSTGVTVALGSGSSMTGVHIYANHMIVQSQSGSEAVSNTHLATADNYSDSDISDVLSVDSNNIAHVGSGITLLVWTGSTFTPGSGVTVGSGIVIRGTFTMSDDNVTLSGSWITETNGSFTASNTVTFDGTYAGRTITSNGSTFNSVTINGSNGAWTLSDATDIDGNLSISTGTLNQGTSTLNIAGNMFIGSSATFTKSTNYAILTLDGDLYVENEAGASLGHVQAGTSPDTINLSGALVVDGLVIGTGDTLVTNGYNLLIGGSGLILNGTLDASNSGGRISTINVSGSWLQFGTGDFISGESTVTFDGTTGSQNITASGAFYNVVIDGNGGTWTGAGNIDVDGDFTITNGTFTATPNVMTVSGSWTRNGGTFNHNSGSITLNGGDQTLSGSNVFYNLTKTGAALQQTLTLAAGVQQSISGALTFKGTQQQRLLLRSSQDGNAAIITLDGESPNATQLLGSLNVKDMDASGGQTLYCQDNCRDNGNNTNWDFTTKFVGVVYEPDGATPLAGKTVKMSIDGGAVTDVDTSDGAGQYTISGATLTGGEIISLFLDDGTATGVTVVLASGSALTGIHLYSSHLIVRSESGSSAITNTQLATADDSGDTAITDVYSIVSGVLQVSTGYTLLVWSGSTFGPGGGVQAGSGIIVNGTFAMGSNNVTLSGAWRTGSNGSFTASNTVTFEAESKTWSIGSNGSSFNNVTFSGAAALWTTADAMDLDGNFSLMAGTFEQGNNQLNIGGNLYIAAGASFIKSSNDSLLILDGDLIIENEPGASLGDLQAGSSPDTITLSGSLLVDNLTVGTGDILVTNGYDIIVGTGGVTLHGLLDASNSGGRISTITVSGSWIAAGTGDFISGSSAVVFNGSGTNNTITASGAFYDLTISGTGGAWTGTSLIDIDGDFTIAAGTFTAPTTITLSGSWLKNDAAIFNHNNGTLSLDGYGQTVSGSNVFYNFEKVVSSPQTLTLAAGVQQSISGALTLRGAIQNLLTIRSTQDGNAAKFVLSITNGTQVIELVDVKDNDASGGLALYCLNCTNAGNNTNWIFRSAITGHLYRPDGSTPLSSKYIRFATGSNVIDTAVTDAGGLFLVSGATIPTGPITLFVNDGTATGVTVVLGSGGVMTGVDIYSQHLIARSDSGTNAITNTHLAVADDISDSDVTEVFTASSNDITVKPNFKLLVWTGSTLSTNGLINVGSGITVRGTFTMNNSGVTLSGSWLTEPNGDFTATNTVTFDGTNSETITSNGSTFSGVTLNGSGGTWTLLDTIDVDGEFTLLNGTFVQSGVTMNVAGDFRLASGTTFTKSSSNSLLTFDGNLVIENEIGTSLGDVATGSGNYAVTMSGNLVVDSLIIGSGSTLVTNGYNLTVGTGGITMYGNLNASESGTRTSTITVSGSWISSGLGGFISGSSSVILNGTTSDILIVSSGAFKSLTVNSSGGTVTATGSLDINGNFTLTNGTFEAPLIETMTVSGNWLKASGTTFDSNSGTVVFDGGSQTISGSTAFYNFTKNDNDGSTFTFAYGTVQTVSGTLTLQGTDPIALKLRSDVITIQWFISLLDGGSQVINYVDVRDSNATGGQTLTCNNCTDGGNNQNWDFGGLGPQPGGSGGGGGGGKTGDVDEAIKVRPCIAFGRPLTAPFQDIDDHWAAVAIKAMHRARYTGWKTNIPLLPGRVSINKGRTRRLFLPDEPMTRYEAAELALLGNCAKIVHRPNSLTFGIKDVPSSLNSASEQEGFRRRIIYTAVDLGIMERFIDGSFRPDEPVTRADALRAMVLAARLPPLEGQPEPYFRDVPVNSWYSPFIERAVHERWITGFPDGTFRPLGPITRGEMAHAVHMMFTVPELRVEEAEPGEFESDPVTTVTGSGSFPTDRPISDPEIAVTKQCLGIGPEIFPPFIDIEGHWSERMVRRLAHTQMTPSLKPLVEGYREGSHRLFFPDRPISRFEVLKLALLSNCIELIEDVNQVRKTFADIPKHGPAGYDEDLKKRVIYTAVELGIINGYADNTVRPDAQITRAEALKILILAANLPPPNDEIFSHFSDVPRSAWYTLYVDRAVRDGLVSGYKDGTFKPGNIMSRAEFAKIISKMIHTGVVGTQKQHPIVQEEPQIETTVDITPPPEPVVAVITTTDEQQPDPEPTPAPVEENWVIPVGCLDESDDAPIFRDTKGHWAEKAIQKLAHALQRETDMPLIRGHEKGTARLFYPDRHITRYEILKLALIGSCHRLLGDSKDTYHEFVDAPKDNSITMRQRVMYTAADLGIIKGYSDGTIRPDAPITRAEATKVFVLSASLPPVAYEGDWFSDIPNGAWYVKYIERALGDGTIRGYSNGTFKPGSLVTRAEATTMLMRMFREGLSGVIKEPVFPEPPKPRLSAEDIDRIQSPMKALKVVSERKESKESEDSNDSEEEMLLKSAAPEKEVEPVRINMCLTTDTSLSPGFSDIGGHWAEQYIRPFEKLQLQNKVYLIEGYTDGTNRYFNPEGAVTRFALLKVALMSNCIPLQKKTGSDSFKEHIAYTAAQLGIISDENDSRMDSTVKRAEALKILLLAKSAPPLVTAPRKIFSDVPLNAWYSPFVERAVYDGYISAESENFRPGDDLKRGEMAKMVQMMVQ